MSQTEIVNRTAPPEWLEGNAKIKYEPLKTPVVNAKAIGDRAMASITGCLDAATDVEKMMSDIGALNDQIQELGRGLADEFRAKAREVGTVVENFAALVAASAERMSEERKHLESIARGDGASP